MADKSSRQSRDTASLDARSKALGEKISRKIAQSRSAPAAESVRVKDYGQSSLVMGLRLSADFLSAIIVGGVLGLLCDKFTGAAPWGLFVFLLLGFAAGVINILRSLGQRRIVGKE